MDKSILKKFAIESRQDLMNKISNKIKTFYVDEEFKKEQKGEVYLLSNEKHSLSLTKEENDKRDLLIKRIKELTLEQVIEEAAYTWFNRIIAIRYMEINDMLPLTKNNSSLGIRVLSSKDNTPDPEILKFTNLINPDLDIDFKKEKYVELKDDNEKFKYVLLLICKKLGKVIPQVFDGNTDYIDILIPDNLLNDAGFITKIINDVPEDNYNQVEIIGWLYQYYITEKKDEVFYKSKKGGKISKNNIPAATQLFTPDWIVKYMVENSLGKYWVEHNGDGGLYPSNNLYPSDTLYPLSSITDNWKYFIKDNIEKQENKLKTTEITFIDPCCGSGHILVYAFEVFYQIYIKAGYNKNDIPELILKNNLFGLDIDDRAVQLSILSVLLKAREYDRNIFNNKVVVSLNIISIQESNSIDNSIIKENVLSEDNYDIYDYIIDVFDNAKEYGSLVKVNKLDYEKIKEKIECNNTLFGIEARNQILPLIKQAEILSSVYDIVVTNPPYMNNNVMTDRMKQFLNKNYKKSKTDLCTAFMENQLVKKDGYLAMINQHSWMFLGSFEELRFDILKNYFIDSMVHLGTRAFEEIGGEVVQTTSWVLKNRKQDRDSVVIKLTDINSAEDKQVQYLKIINEKAENYYKKNLKGVLNIPNYPVAYWIDNKIIDIFVNNSKLSKVYDSKTGMTTGDNELFLRFWQEVDYTKIQNNHWVHYNKGGGYRKWYGNLFNVINWEENGKKIKDFKKSTIRNEQYYFRECITWNLITTTNISVRALNVKSIMGDAGPACYSNNKNDLIYLLGLLNSNTAKYLLNIINPTMNYSCGVMDLFPFIKQRESEVESIVNQNIDISKEDWDSFETSWDFITHPLIEYKTGTGYENDLSNWQYKIKDSFKSWEENSNEKYNILKNNEEELNRIFIDIYKLEDKLKPEVEDKNITIRKADKVREIKSLISYAVGCMFGRYSLDEDGLIYAGGEFDSSKYKTFKVDDDNIIPITDESYFNDDIVNRFKRFIEVVYGKETLNENLDYIADTLGKKGTETSEDTIRRYFVNDFYNDHIKTYQKRPIYWLFDSGKKNGFKCLIYMHRYSKDLVASIRTKYIPKVQTTYEKLLSDVEYRLSTELSLNDKKEMEKKKIELNGKIQEVKEYYEKIANVANRMIDIDLDDGVVANYAKFTYLNPKTNKEESILGKIK